MRDIEERKVMRDIHDISVSLKAISKDLQKLTRILSRDDTEDASSDITDPHSQYEEPLGILR